MRLDCCTGPATAVCSSTTTYLGADHCLLHLFELLVLLLHDLLLQLHQALVVQLCCCLRLLCALLLRCCAAARQEGIPVALLAALERLLYLLPPVFEGVQQVPPAEALLLTPVRVDTNAGAKTSAT